MAIIINIDVMMAKRKMSLGELAERVDITPANLSILKTESESHPVLDARSDLPRAGLPAGRHHRIPPGPAVGRVTKTPLYDQL